MTDHWKDVKRGDWIPFEGFCESPQGTYYDADAVDAARAKDAAERAAREAAYEARVQRDHDEIVELTAEIARLTQEVTTLRAREAKLRAAARNYMSQFGQALEANEIPYERYQQEADAALRAALAEGEDTRD